MASISSLQHLLSLNRQEQIGYFKARTYSKPALIKKIKQTKNLRSSLGLINQHIRSLATYPYEGNIHIERSLDHKELIFCICKKCKEKFTLRDCLKMI